MEAKMYNSVFKTLSQITFSVANFINSLGIFYYLIPTAVALFAAVLAIINLTSKKFTVAGKATIYQIQLCVAALWITFIIPSALKLPPYRFAEQLMLSAFSWALSFMFSALLSVKKRERKGLTKRDKRLIARLTAKDVLPDVYELMKEKSEPAYVRRVEFVGKTDDDNSAEPDLNGVKRIIGALRRHELTREEEDELDKTEMDIDKFSSRTPTPYERQSFNSRLLKIVKLMSKYSVS